MVDKQYRRRIMKIESIALPSVPTTPIEDMPIINAEQIKTILYLGIKGNLRPVANAEHAVDTYA
jgi:hypothetical protein